MKQYMILFLVGRDRPGIVDDVSKVLLTHEANIEDSRGATLGGCFSIMILFSVDADRMPAVRQGFQDLKRMGFEWSLHEATDPAALPRQAELPLNIQVTAMDHPGIVQAVVGILRKYNVNVESMTTRVTQAPYSGAPLFGLELGAQVPADQPMARIKRDLTDLAAEMNLDLTFSK
jgi:glycine cleavage system transcriptional repressor